jgi:hypothetical protein
VPRRWGPIARLKVEPIENRFGPTVLPMCPAVSVKVVVALIRMPHPPLSPSAQDSVPLSRRVSSFESCSTSVPASVVGLARRAPDGAPGWRARHPSVVGLA